MSYRAWAIKTPNHGLHLGVFETKKAAITNMTGCDLKNKVERRKEYALFRKAGWRIVRVLVSVIQLNTDK